jgi:uncharacterized protein (DUF885 family)
MRLSSYLVLCLCVSASALLGSGAQQSRTPAFDRFVDELASDWMRTQPIAATTAQYFSGAEQDALDRQLTPISKEARGARVALARRGLQALDQFDLFQFTEMQRSSAAMLRWQLHDIISNDAFEDYEFVFSQTRGLQVQLVNLLTQTHPLRNRRDVENYLARLDLVGAQLEEGIEIAREREGRGFRPPAFILRATIAQLGPFLDATPAQNVLVTSLEERASRIEGMSFQDRRAFVTSSEEIVRGKILPAFRQVQTFLQTQLSHANEDAGLSRLPNGVAAYGNALRRNTTTQMSADEVHALGLKEVARIEAAMDRILRELGYEQGTLNARFAKLDATLQPKEADPRPALVERHTDLVRDAEKRAALLFDLMPKAPCEVQREPAFTEKTASARYMPPARDGSRPGVFWVPLPGPTYEIAVMRSTTYHETVPGHHFQLAIQIESTELPLFRRNRAFGIITAHHEGWALYAEQLAAENGWYEGDKIGALGQLADELLRARRLVVDTGLHVKKWTRQQAIDYGMTVSEVERYVVNPGQACAYKIGQLRLVSIREKAKGALGSKFSLKEFHNVVLRNGNVPLDVLQEIVERWVQTKSGP